jgi:hypothetical protein
VRVIEVTDEQVHLEVPDDPRDAPRIIPRDLIRFGNEARSWFAWDMKMKQPRAPYNGYAGTVQWGRDAVSWDNRVGTTYAQVIDALNGSVNGHLDVTWRWGWVEHDDGSKTPEQPRELYPMCIIPHEDFSPEPGLILIDLDDVIEPRGDGTATMTREAWDVICRSDAYAEVSSSMTGAHVLIRGRIPSFVDGVVVMEDLEQRGHCEIRGYPGDGRVIGTTWMHIEGRPRHAVPHDQDAIDALAEDLLPDEDQLSDEEQAAAVFDAHETEVKGDESGSSPSRSAYYDLDPVPIANTGPFAIHGRNGQGPHPVHGGTKSDDSESTNFGVDRDKGWNCWAHEGGAGGALHLIAVLEGIRDCDNAADVMHHPRDALKTCLAARDKYTNGELDDEDPPTIALKGVCEVQRLDYPADGPLDRGTYAIARGLYDHMGDGNGGDGQ